MYDIGLAVGRVGVMLGLNITNSPHALLLSRMQIAAVIEFKFGNAWSYNSFRIGPDATKR